MAAFIGGSLGFQVGIYLWHVPDVFPRPVEKRRETFVAEHHVAPPKKSLRAPDTSGTVTFHILTTGSRDISMLKQRLPDAHIFKGSIGYDKSCQDVLKKIGVRFKDHYYDTLDYIEEGKLGHWCSNLRFIQDCNHICVLIEDDVILTDADVIALRKESKVPFHTPVMRLGQYDDINVWNSEHATKVFDAVREGIDNPTDLFFEKRHFYTRRKRIGKLVDPTHSTAGSIIRSMQKKLKLTQLNIDLNKDDILWVVPAFKRAWSLKFVLDSLSSQTSVLVSTDADVTVVDDVLRTYKVDVIRHLWSCARHPNVSREG